MKIDVVTVNNQTIQLSRPEFNKSLKKLSTLDLVDLSENAKLHWRHKPYTCDFGGDD